MEDYKGLRLDEGEVLCSGCEGEGTVLDGENLLHFCKMCKGDGKLDWVENLTGGKNISWIERLRATESYEELVEVINLGPEYDK